MSRIRGLVVPFQVVGDLGSRERDVRVKFARGSITVPDDPSRVKLLIHHDQELVVGYGVAFEETDRGLFGEFEVALEEVLDEVRGKLTDGLSPGIDFTDATRARIRSSRNGAPLAEGRLREVSLVAVPAFVDAVAEVVS